MDDDALASLMAEVDEPVLQRKVLRLAVAAAEREPINPQAIAYLNRLSDHLFVMSRAINARDDGDVLWVPGASR